MTPYLGDRIMIIGSPGAGKSTLSGKLHTYTGLPVIHLDQHYWRSGWVNLPKEEWQAVHDTLVAGQRWIIEGNYPSVAESRLARAQSIIWLDFPRAKSMWGVLSRWAKYKGTTRPDMADGCPEQIDLNFLRFVWEHPHKSRPAIVALLGKKTNQPVYHLQSRRQVADFLSLLK